MKHGDLKAILEAGDVEACVAYFEHATEDEHAKLWPRRYSESGTPCRTRPRGPAMAPTYGGSNPLDLRSPRGRSRLLAH